MTDIDLPGVPRPEHPRPQFVRDQWLCLNGQWGFEIDTGDSGVERGLVDRELSGTITVPFSPESPLSGVGVHDFLTAVWYRRSIDIPEAWSGQRILLHFQAVDYDATVWVDGREVGRHRGGFTPFTCDLGVLEVGRSATVVVRARDPRFGPQPRGKQSVAYHPEGPNYWRTTGIWQTVWLEAVPVHALRRPRLTPSVEAGTILVEQGVDGARPDLVVRARLADDDGQIVEVARRCGADLSATVELAIPAERRRLWSPADPHLYQITIELLDGAGAVLDRAATYAGLRGVSIEGNAIRLNGEVIFQRLVLDQGFYPDGGLTAPSDDALRADIELSLAAGFDGARLHQKVFEERFLYHADRLGYLVWGEFGDWGCGGYGPTDDQIRPDATYITQWLEAVQRDYSHPSIIGWCPLNETAQPLTDRIRALDDVTLGMVLAVRAADRTRPVIDASGYGHRVASADVYDSHDYEQDVEVFTANHAGAARGEPYVNVFDRAGHRDTPMSVPYRGQPYLVSEFGGAWWSESAADADQSWGYGQRPRSVDDVVARFDGLCSALLDNPGIAGYCYTQLTDVYQEKNGIYTFERVAKLDLERLRAIQRRPAAIELAGPRLD